MLIHDVVRQGESAVAGASQRRPARQTTPSSMITRRRTPGMLRLAAVSHDLVGSEARVGRCHAC